jgi:hypothetical protein
MLEGWLIAKLKLVLFPFVGALPVPVQPVHTCWVISDSGTGGFAEKIVFDPALYQPLPEVVPYGELTVK